MSIRKKTCVGLAYKLCDPNGSNPERKLWNMRPAICSSSGGKILMNVDHFSCLIYRTFLCSLLSEKS